MTAKNNTTADVLIEIGCEELPAGELHQLIDDFASSLGTELDTAQLQFAKISKYATPRRLALIINQLQNRQSDSQTTRRGPSLSAAYKSQDSKEPTPAAIGFAKSCGLEMKDLTTISTDKGEYLSATVTTKGNHINDLLPTMLNKIVPKLPRSKTMHWDDSDMQFVRPVRWLLALIDTELLPWEIFGLQASNKTFGHRFYTDAPITINRPDEYEDVLLKKGYVIADIAKRKQTINKCIDLLVKDSDYAVSQALDEELLDELAAITEYPVGYIGEFESSFLKLPSQVLESVLTLKQRYIPLIDKQGQMSSKFIFIANIDSKDKQLLIAGNQAVVRPRLADATFFYQQDLERPLSSRLEQLKKLSFFSGLGSMKEKSACCKDLARFLATKDEWQDVAQSATLAAELCKCDLTSLMVQEFPELQGIIGGYYLEEELSQGTEYISRYTAEDVHQASQAITEHYLPKRAGDAIAASKAGKVLAIVERMDKLIGLFHKGQKPSGEKDPYALRRTALGLARTIIESGAFVDLRELGEEAVKCYEKHNGIIIKPNTIEEVLEFINERVCAYGKEQHLATDSLDAVFCSPQADLYDAWLRTKAIEDKRSSHINSLVGINKRLKNILGKHGIDSVAVNEKLFTTEQERQVFKILADIRNDLDRSCADKEYAKCFELLSGLSEPLEDFFDQVMVMVEDKPLRENRLVLLGIIHKQFLKVADFSRIAT